MLERKRSLLLGSSFLSFAILASCGSPANPPPPKWTVENRSASTGGSQASAQKPSSASKLESASQSRLDTLCSRQAASSGPRTDAYFAFDSYDLPEDARTAI